jgi:hypothetical protein
MWIPGLSIYYNESVPQDITQALAREYSEHSLNQSQDYAGHFPYNTVDSDVITDSLAVIPRLHNYADPIQRYFDTIIFIEEAKP